MSFIRLFDGDLDLSSSYPGSNLKSNISDELISGTPLKISGFTGLASEANGNYFINGATCNCHPALENSTSASNVALSNSSDFSNSDSFYYFRSPSALNNNNTFDSLYAHPNYFKVVSDSAKFSGASHYLDFSLETDASNSNSSSYFAFVFDDENLNNVKKYLNYNLSSSTLNLSLSFINKTAGSPGFDCGLIFKQSGNFFAISMGSTGSSSSATSLSFSKTASSQTPTFVYGSSSSSLDLSGQTPYEIGVYFKDVKNGHVDALATNFNLSITNVTPKKYFIFNKDNKTVISDKICDVAGNAHYIYSNSALNSTSYIFSSSSGSTSLFSNQKAYGVNYGTESEATTHYVRNSDADATLDSLDADPHGKTGASFSVLPESGFTSAGISYNIKIDFVLEGFKFEFDGTNNGILNSNSIIDVETLFIYIAILINTKTSETGIRAEKYSGSSDLIFWRPKGGPYVSAYANAYVSNAEIRIASQNSNYNYS